MNKTSNIIAICIGIFLTIIPVGSVFGAGFNNSCIGIKGMGMGHSLIGIADDASAVYFNPGGLVFNDENTWYAEAYGYYAPTKFKYTANSTTDRSDEAVSIPSFFISKTFENWAFGFGAYIPYAGGGTAYDNFQGSPYDLESFAGWFAFNPAAAYKLSPNLSVGIGISLYVGWMESKFYNEDPLVQAMVKNEYSGIAGYGGHIGLMYKPTKEWSVGFTARSEIPIEMDGEVKVDGTKYDSEVEFTLPSSFSLGFGYQPDPKLTIGLSFYYFLYGDTDKITFETEGLGVDKNPTHYKNCWIVGLGLEYKIKSDLVIRGGIKFDQGAAMDKGLNPATVDVDLITPTINVAYDITESIEMNIAGLKTFGLEEEYDSKKYTKDFLAFIIGIRFKY